MSSYKTICCYCGVGCGIVVQKDRDGRLTVQGDAEHPVNKGMLCSKGMNLHYTVMDQSDRLLYPQLRKQKGEVLQRVSWDEALAQAASVFKDIIQKYGPDAVGFYASGQCLTEEYYVINKLVKGFIGTNNMDTNSRLCMSSAVAAYKMSLGEDSVPACYDDIELADCILVAGANPAWCHPILWRRVEAAKAANPNLKIIVTDPRETQTCSLADIHLAIKPGTDVVLHHAIGRVLLESGLINEQFIRQHTEGFDEYRSKVMERSIAESASLCDVTADAITQAASYIGNANGFMSMWTMGLNQSVIGVQKNLSLINLHLVTGKIGKPGCGPLSLTGQPNAMGGREVGGLANLLPAHRDLNSENDRLYVQQFWGGSPISPKPGYTATEMFDALNTGKLKAIWIVCTNPLVSLPDVRQAEAALKKADFVVVQEVSNKPETLAYADIVLPAAAWLEKEGTMTNGERRISYLSKAVDAPGEALPDAEIICRFAQKMGYHGFHYRNTSEIYEEHCALTKGTTIDISGLSYSLLKERSGIQWPYQQAAGKGTIRLFTEHRFYTRSGKAIIQACRETNLSEETNAEFPLILTTGRIRDQWHTMSKTGKVNKLKQHIAEPYLEMHNADAAIRNIAEGDLVVVNSRRGQIRLKAKLSTTIRTGTVFAPMHWGKGLGDDLSRVNNVTHNLVDAISKEPDFKFSAVEVTRYRKPKQKIIVVGAGAGAFGFVNSYRAINKEDEIVIFSKEDYPFYNRVMLPDYISGMQRWEQLIKMQTEEEHAHQIVLRRGVSIISIDRQAKQVTDSLGETHSYDILLLATGSNAAKMKNVPALDGIFTMRSREDADQFKNYLGRQAKVAIIGGGLLGVELAASLCAIDVKVHLMQATARLMERQLDAVASSLLHDTLVDKGISVYYQDTVQEFLGDKRVSGVRLGSGLAIECDAVVIAIGTVPNIELAKLSGIECGRGVLVDGQLKTSDPVIYAIGEIAEYKGFLYGITAAAEEQAEVVARHLQGDASVIYQGSLLMNILKLHDTLLCSMGKTESPPDDPSYEEIILCDKARRFYKKCVIQYDRLVGAILIGDKNEFAEYRELIKNKIELAEKRGQLLRPGNKPVSIEGKIVCSCGGVGEGNIRKAVREGNTNLQALCKASGAGMGCGSCRPEVQSILKDELSIRLER